jgi:hypothetical protein
MVVNWMIGLQQVKGEWISDYCFTPNEQITAISWRGHVIFWRDDDDEVDFYSASSLKQQFAGRHDAPLGHIILIPSQPVFALNLLRT